jgi:hypothetical protein
VLQVASGRARARLPSQRRGGEVLHPGATEYAAARDPHPSRKNPVRESGFPVYEVKKAGLQVLLGYKIFTSITPSSGHRIVQGQLSCLLVLLPSTPLPIFVNA